jgi:hypothetical protein
MDVVQDGSVLLVTTKDGRRRGLDLIHADPDILIYQAHALWLDEFLRDVLISF